MEDVSWLYFYASNLICMTVTWNTIIFPTQLVLVHQTGLHHFSGPGSPTVHKAKQLRYLWPANTSDLHTHPWEEIGVNLVLNLDPHSLQDTGNSRRYIQMSSKDHWRARASYIYKKIKSDCWNTKGVRGKRASHNRNKVPFFLSPFLSHYSTQLPPPNLRQGRIQW